MTPHRYVTGTRLAATLGLALTVAAMAGCGGNSAGTTSTSTTSSTQTGGAFVVGTDAPAAGVVSFNVQIQSITATDANNNTVSLISGTPTVDFARFNGLQTLLDFNDVPAGSYSSVSIALGPATIGYLNAQPGAAPTVQTETATLTQSTVQATLSTPLVITQGEPVGLHMDFDLRKSVQVDGNGQITGAVNPTFDLKAITPSDSGGYIDQFDAAVLSVDPQTQSFQVEGPHGRQLTVQVNGQTDWANNEGLGNLSSSSIVTLSGTIDRADATIDADDVAILSQDGFYAGGLVTYVTPGSGAASSFDLYVRGLLPTTTGLTLGQVAQVDLTGNEKFFIYWMRNPLTEFLFNPSAIVPGQHVSVGGPASGAANAQAVTAKRVVLRHWGYNGTVVSGSVDEGNGTFQMQVAGFAGQLVPGTVTVYTSPVTQFRDGLSGLSDLGSGEIRVVGLLLRDPTSGQLVLLAHYVDALN